MIIIKCAEILKNLGSLNEIQVPDDKHITVCGDTHG